MKPAHKRILSILAAAAVTCSALPQRAPLSLLQPVITASADDSVVDKLDCLENEEHTAVSIIGYSGEDTVLVIPDTINDLPVTAIGSQAFQGKNSLVSVKLPDTVTEIGFLAFTQCQNLKTIEMPTSLKTIGSSAFSSCPVLEKIALPNGTESIGVSAFASCSKLKSVTIPETVTSIGENAFHDTEWLTVMRSEDPLVVVNHILIDGKACSGNVDSLPDVTYINSQAFSGCTALTGITIPAGVVSIGGDAFYNCKGLETISMQNGLTQIGSRAFYCCSGLTEINIPDSVTEIGTTAFFGCSKLASVHLPASLTVIIGASQQGTFQGCSALTEIRIPDGVTSIGKLAFAQCDNLKKVKIPDSVTSIDSLAFIASGNVIICAHAGSYAERYAKTNGKEFEELDAEFSGVSLTLTDDLALNFSAAELNADNKDDYKVIFSGKCEENGKDTAFTEKNGRYCASANVSADHMDETITAKLYKKAGDEWAEIDTFTYSVSQYLENTAPEADWSTAKAEAFDKLVKTVKLYGAVSYAYFNTPNNMPNVTDHRAQIHTDAYNKYLKYDVQTSEDCWETKDTDLFSLVLNSRMALRCYFDGLSEGQTGKLSSNNSIITAVNGKNGCYFEISGLTPLRLNECNQIQYNGYIYQFSPLTWAYRVTDSLVVSKKNLAMANILFEYFTDATAFHAAN